MNIENLKTDESTSVSFLNSLRSKTSESHQNLEKLPISRSIIDPEITIKEYALYLSLMHDIVQNFENDIHPILSDVISDLNERKKAQHILNDLEVTGIQKKKIISPFINSSEMSVQFAMGIMYVVEGSTLGGRFILKNIKDSLGYDEVNGASYFSGYGNKTGSYWKKFLKELTDFQEKTNSEDEIINGAAYGFKIINDHLSAHSL
ncbi:biliverdin-producing heme oxygenase [Flavobacterium sp. W22_SRS_FK3]|uniref:biliverdin-producing heme oxygenase n=1 Tax=Flavobacterium sp. W22_SRS_FK3 TaxID=3240275 RepID=UPI003F925822